MYILKKKQFMRIYFCMCAAPAVMAEEQREVLRAQLRSKGTKNPADMELYELSQLSGITMDPHVFE